MQLGARTFEVDDDDAQQMFRERGWTDGLPVVAPTPGRVEARLGGRAPRRIMWSGLSQ